MKSKLNENEWNYILCMLYHLNRAQDLNRFNMTLLQQIKVLIPYTEGRIYQMKRNCGKITPFERFAYGKNGIGYADDYKIADSMGRTEKFFRHSMAYKYEDELFETVLTDIEWNTSKTGLINPVAIFEPIDLNGAITTRATLHNITYIKDMMLGIGDRIRVYRSNMVIPKVHDSIDKSGNFSIPDKCPICGQPTRIVKENDSEVLMCENPNCKGKLLGRLIHATSRNALDIENLSESTIEKFINLGWLNSIKDIYHLSDHENEMKALEGFGKRSVEKLLASIEKSRKTSLERFLYSLSIPLLGKSASMMIADSVDYDFDVFIDKMTIKGLSGSKKLKDIFINEKVSIRDRQVWPVVTDSTDTIVWLPGLKKSQFDKKKNEKYDIIIKYS